DLRKNEREEACRALERLAEVAAADERSAEEFERAAGNRMREEPEAFVVERIHDDVVEGRVALERYAVGRRGRVDAGARKEGATAGGRYCGEESGDEPAGDGSAPMHDGGFYTICVGVGHGASLAAGLSSESRRLRPGGGFCKTRPP